MFPDGFCDNDDCENHLSSEEEIERGTCDECEDEKGVCMNCGAEMDHSPMHPWCPKCDAEDLKEL